MGYAHKRMTRLAVAMGEASGGLRDLNHGWLRESMRSAQRWWDCFWSDRVPVSAAPEKESDNWHGLVWKVVSEDWYDLYEKLAPGSRMLECGCGSARVSQYMAARGYECTMVDYSERAITLARAGFTARSMPGRFVIGDLHDLPFPDARFDIVYCGGVLEFLADIHGPIQEMVRVLRPGGIFSTNVVPDKFSIQTVADVQRTIVHSLRNLVRANLKDALKVVRSIPSDYRLNSASLSDYVNCCKQAGLAQVTGLGTSPFPALALPAVGARAYVRAMKALLSHWRRFNQSPRRWTEIWGVTYTIYGTKGLPGVAIPSRTSPRHERASGDR